MVNLFVYLEIFTPVAWGVCSLMLFVLAMALVLHSYHKKLVLFAVVGPRNLRSISDIKLINKQHQTQNVEQDQIGILSSISVALRMLLNLDFQLRLKSYPSMIIIFVGSMLGYLFFSLYTSDLTAKMTANPPPLPIRSGSCSL